ncbi:MAG: outer membrane protein assembly factor BamA [Verrucomicrobia bacterium]|nr:outer membrane protein assembly factor BamA [Verrucomicrobiota bacterium]
MRFHGVRLLAGALLMLAFQSAAWAVTVREVGVEGRGPAPVDEDFVRAHILVAAGDELEAQNVVRDVKSLKDTGKFSYVGSEYERSGDYVILTYIVEQKPRIRRLRIEGADYIGNHKVKKWLKLSAGDVVDDGILGDKCSEAKAEYSDRYFYKTKFSWNIEPIAGTTDANVVVKVKEGPRASVRRISLEGNEAISDREIRDRMAQKTWHIFSWLTNSGLYEEDRLSADVEMIKRLYRDKGYLDVEVDGPKVTEVGKHKLGVSYSIKEGRAYAVDGVSVAGVTLFAEDEILNLVKLDAGSVASMRVIDRTAQKIRDYYSNRGYLRTQVRKQLDADVPDGTVKIAYEVREGTLASVGDVRIRGNKRTKDKVIRRELTVLPGDRMNEVKVDKSERRLRNLGFFETVTSSIEPTDDPGLYDVTFDVKEQKTGQFLVGAGFSSVDKLIGFAEISQGNFDIKGWPNFTGGGQKIKLRGQLGTQRRDIEFTFIEPWFLDRKLSLELSAFQHDRRFLSDDYDQRNTGASAGIGKALGGFNRMNVTYGYEIIDVYNVDDSVSDLIKAEEGDRSKSYLRLGVTHDSRDHPFISTRGYRASLTGELAGGPLAGETDLYRVDARYSQYWSVWWNHVINLRGWGAAVEEYGDSDHVPIFDRLFLGGGRTIRGFNFRDVGPKDESGEPIGGRTAAYLTAEYTVPIVDKIRFAAFYDAGMVWEEAFDADFSNLNSSYGIGIRFDIPMLPLRFDYAWPIEGDDFTKDDGARFNFMIGYVY